MPMLQQDLDLSMDFPFLSEGLDLFENLNLSPFGELWKTELESLSDAWSLQDDSLNLDCKRGSSMIRVHDCMWAGTCGSKDHVGRKPNQTSHSSRNLGGSSSSNCMPSLGIGSVNSCSSPIRIPSNKVTSAHPQNVPSPRNHIKKPSLPAPTKVLHRPETPQSEDDLSKTPDDHELSWSKGVAVSEITGQRRTETTSIIKPAATIHSSVSFDHNYNTKKPDDLGVQTPSDSEEDEVESEEEEEEDSQSSEVEEPEDEEEEDDEEEEIDVVSLKPSSPPRKKVDRRLQPHDDWRTPVRHEEWRRPEIVVRPDQELRLEISQEENAVRFASQMVSKRITAETSRVGRGRQKRKRLSSEEEEVIKAVACIKADANYKPYYRRATASSRPRNTTRRKYTTPSKKTRISTDSETDSTEKRSQHNDMERKRRIDLRNAFEDLRCLVPSLADTRRAAKVAILRDAASYCLQLTSNSKTLQSQVSILSKEQEKLRSNLSKLRRLIANKHVGSNSR